MPLAVPIEATVAPGQTITSAWANAGVRDAVNFLVGPPVAVLTQTAAQSFATGSLTALAWDTTILDTYGGHSNTVNNSRYTAQVAGLYLPCVIGAWLPNATGVRYTTLAKNGSQLNYLSGPQSGNATFVNATTVDGAIQMSVGDYLEGWGIQNSGGNLNTSPAFCQIVILWVHS